PRSRGTRPPGRCSAGTRWRWAGARARSPAAGTHSSPPTWRAPLTGGASGPASSAALATPAGAIRAGSRFGISAAPDLLLAGAGREFTVWSTEQQRALRSFSVDRADPAVPVFSALD